MITKNVIIYNKEGFPMNLNWNEDFKYYNGKVYFDKNSTDTYKTQAFYLFEKVLPTDNTLQAYLDKYQVFNTQDFYSWPSFGQSEIEIQDIKKTNSASAFYSKWIYADGIENMVYEGMYVYFKGLTGYAGTSFDELISGDKQVFQIVDVQRGRAMVITSVDNSVSLATFVPAAGKVMVPIDVIAVDKLSSSPYDETFPNTKLYQGKKISLVSNRSENEGVYTIKDTTTNLQKDIYTFGGIFSPSAGDSLKLEITMLTDRFLISNGNTQFAPFLDPNGIQLPYIPSTLKVGDQVQGEAKAVPLSGSNTVNFTITSIDKVNSIIGVTPAPTSQTVDCYVYMSTNVITIDQPIVLDNNNLPSLQNTYLSVYNNNVQALHDVGVEVYMNSNLLIFKSSYAHSYFSVVAKRINSSGVQVGPTHNPSTTASIDVYPHNLLEELVTTETLPANVSLYTRSLVFNTIDNFGLNININGIDYNVDFDTSVANTTSDWITQYQTTLDDLGITVNLATTYVLNDTIVISPDFPNRSVVTKLNMGDFSDYFVEYKQTTFANIKTQLLITINGTDYAVPFITSDANTVTSWVNAYKNLLKTLGIIVEDDLSAGISFRVLDPERTLEIEYNIGYIPKSGDFSITETDNAPNNASDIIAGNEIKTVSGTYNLTNFYSTGQKISIQGATKKPQNQSFNVIGIDQDNVCLSYQGPFWQQGLPVFSLDIKSDYFIRYPKNGLSGVDNQATLRWSWKDTQIDDIFFYDFSGDQLVPSSPGFPEYNGQLPLCGTDGDTELKLIKKPNDNLAYISDPTKQQTVFDVITNVLPFQDSTNDYTSEPSPLQVFIGLNSKVEGTVKSRLYLEFIEDLEFTLTTQSNLTDDLWNFADNYVEILSPTGTIDFTNLGFKKDQIIKFTFKDTNSDNRNIATLDNGGVFYRILDVQQTKIFFTRDVIAETSVKVVAKTTPPYYDSSGNALFESRTLNVTMTVMPSLVAYFDVYGESEQEDERHKINLNNRNYNILKLQDFFIFKEVDINEQGIDWTILNRKRKHLLEIYSEIFDNVSSYKAIIQAINFFGYNDLTFTEFYQNVNVESNKFGQLFNMELLNIFDKSVPGWSFDNLAVQSLRNQGYRKTNLFSLNYNITDKDGNFVSAYSQDEVQIKLLGLKRWLKEHLVPIPAKIIDINGKFKLPYKFDIKHESYKLKGFRTEEYSAPVDFKVSGYLQPISLGSNTYQIAVDFFSAKPIEWFSYRVRTFYIEQYIDSSTYNIGDVVMYDGKLWIATASVGALQLPGISSSWSLTTIDVIPNVQIFTGYRYDDTPVAFTINDLVDPHFVVEVFWHSDYSCTLNNKRTFSVIPNFFDAFVS